MTGEIRTIGIIGAGLVGAAWAAFFAAKGLAVNVYDISADASRDGMDTAIRYLAFMLKHDMLSSSQHAAAVKAIRMFDTLGDTVTDVDFVQESVSERYDVKRDVFRQIEAHAPTDCIIASSSSALLMTEIQKGMAHPQRSLIAHPFNPAHLIPLVELVAGEKTNPHVVEQTRAFLEQPGKVPIGEN